MSIDKDDLKTATTTALEMASRLGQISSAGQGSLPASTASTRLAPVTIIDNRFANADPAQVTALLQTLVSLYSGYYLQAVSLAMNVDGASVLSILDQFSDNSDVRKALGSRVAEWASTEDLEVLPMEWSNEDDFMPTLESKDAIRTIAEPSNLAVGKLIEVTLTGERGNKVTVPVQITLLPKVLDSRDIVGVTAANSTDKSYKGRYIKMRMGEIRFVKDWIFAMDLIEADRKAITMDKTGLLLKNRSKRLGAFLKDIIRGKTSPNSISSMMIVTTETAREMELAQGGKFESSKVRAKYFESNALAMLVVVDVQMERFTLYQRGIAEPGRYTFEDIKDNDRKAGSNDLTAIMKAYRLGEAPSSL